MNNYWVRFKEVIKGNTDDEILFKKNDDTDNTRYAIQEKDKDYIIISSIANDVNCISSIKIPTDIFKQCGYVDL